MTREETKVLLPIIQAYAEGKAIESRCIKGDKSLWYDDEDPSFDGDFEFRIKPEPKYRPFKDAEVLGGNAKTPAVCVGKVESY